MHPSSACSGFKPRQEHSSHLSERLIQLSQDALLIEHLALVTVLIVVVDSLPHIGWQLVEGHVLLHLFVLQGHRDTQQSGYSKGMVLKHRYTATGNSWHLGQTHKEMETDTYRPLGLSRVTPNKTSLFLSLILSLKLFLSLLKDSRQFRSV